MSFGRRAEVELTWQTTGRDAVDISRDIAPYLLGLTCTDNLSGAADDLTLELEDRDGLWSGDWRPTFGDSVVARLQAEGWLTGTTDARLGQFAYDDTSYSGPPSRLALRCISAPLATGLRLRKRTRAWQGVTLQQIASDIATRADLILSWGPESAGRAYRRKEQKKESDLEFLMARCDEQGLMLKVTEGVIAIYDEAEREQVEPVGTIHLRDSERVKGWTFDDSQGEHYSACRVSFFDPRTGKTHSGTFSDPENTDGQTLEKTRHVGSIAEAEEVAEALLRNANRFAAKGKLNVVGDPGLFAGLVFDLEGARGFDGRFIVTRAEHRVGDGYTCDLEVRRVLEGY